MVEHIEAPGGEGLPRFGRADIGPDEPRALGYIRFMSAGQVIEDHHLPPLPQIRLGDMGADEPRTARDQHPAAHAARLGIPISCNWLVKDHRPWSAPQYRWGPGGGNRWAAGSGTAGQRRKATEPSLCHSAEHNGEGAEHG